MTLDARESAIVRDAEWTVCAEERYRMGMAITAPRFTVYDLDKFPDDGNRYELLDGMLLVTPSPANAHQVVSTRLQAMLWTAASRSGDAHVVGPGTIRVPPSLHLEPDLLVYPSRFAPGIKWDDISEHWLAVEILSRSSRMYDREFKRDAYLALGLREVWLVDTHNRTVEVFRKGFTELVRDTIRWRVPQVDRIVAIALSEVFAGFV